MKNREKAAILLAGAAVVMGGLLAYGNSFSGAMVYDDLPSIAGNPALHHLWPLRDLLRANPAGGVTVSGRPILNLSLAINYALGQNRVWGYHAANLALHLLAGLALLGIVRRTLMRRQGSFGSNPPGLGVYRPAALAGAVALLWTVHPLQTEAVTYIVQRAESMMGLFYFLTLYAFIRQVEATDPAGEKAGSAAARRGAPIWGGLSVLCCLLGMATKEVMATAPLIVLFYDRTFVAQTFAQAWRRRRGFYAALAATWLPLGYWVASTGGNRGGTVGFGVGVNVWAYGLTQFEAILHYLRLSLWPDPLVFDYGTFWVRRAAEVAPAALLVLLLLAATVWGLTRRGSSGATPRALGFLGAWFFGILAPTSLLPGTTQMIVEHRVYLPLAAVVVALVLGLDALAKKTGREGSVFLVTGLALAAALGGRTFRRNANYRSGLALWGDTLAHRPANAVAHYNYGVALDQAQRLPEAMEHFTSAVQLRPDLAETHYNLGYALFQLGRFPEAVAEDEQAVRLKPAYPEAHNNLGIALAALGRPNDAIGHYQEALRLRPDNAQVRDNFGNALLQLGQVADAVEQYGAAVRLDPASARAQANLGSALMQLNRLPDALSALAEAVRLDPDLTEARAKLGDVLMELGRPAEAIPQYEAVVALQPNEVQARNNLGIALAATGRLTDAIQRYEEVLQRDPQLAEAHYNLGNAWFRLGRPAEAATEYAAVLRLKPADMAARSRLALAQRALAGARHP